MKEAEDSGASNNKELYALLHVSPEASDEEIRKAYRQWAQIYHPDKYQAQQVTLLFYYGVYIYFSILGFMCLVLLCIFFCFIFH